MELISHTPLSVVKQINKPKKITNRDREQSRAYQKGKEREEGKMGKEDQLYDDGNRLLVVRTL